MGHTILEPRRTSPCARRLAESHGARARAPRAATARDRRRADRGRWCRRVTSARLVRQARRQAGRPRRPLGSARSAPPAGGSDRSVAAAWVRPSCFDRSAPALACRAPSPVLRFALQVRRRARRLVASAISYRCWYDALRFGSLVTRGSPAKAVRRRGRRTAGGGD